MQATRETNQDICAFNDFALVKLHPADVGKVNPSVPGFGGPTGVGGPGANRATVSPTATPNCGAASRFFVRSRGS